jgi:hypothetical protein
MVSEITYNKRCQVFLVSISHEPLTDMHSIENEREISKNY